MESFSAHLERYDIFSFDSNEYWPWGAEKLGPKAKRLNQLRRPLQGRHPTKRQLLAFYDFIADPDIASVVHSMKTDAIKSSGEAIAAHIGGRRRVLEVGCAIGYMTTWLAAIEPERVVTGVDFSQRAVETATQCAKRLGIENVTFALADIVETLPAGPYDAVCDSQTLWGLAGDLDSAVKNIVGQLQPAGILVSVPAAGRAASMHEYVNCLRMNGLGPVELDFVTFSDAAVPSAYPVLISELGHPGNDLDIDGQYDRILAKLRSGAE